MVSEITASRYETLLRFDIKAITRDLPETFSGKEPVCLSVFQPTPEGGRMVLIDKANANSDQPIWTSPGLSAHNSFVDPDAEIQWKEWDACVHPDALKHYRATNPEAMRMRLLERYCVRFPKGVEFDREGGHVVEDTLCRVRFVCPTSDSWRSLPRFGMLYTFGNHFGTGARLAVESVAAARHILTTRLRLFLDERNLLLDKSAFEISTRLASRHSVTHDEILYVVAKLIFVHQFFYPQRQVANTLLARLSVNAERVWTRHAWPAFPAKQLDEVDYDEQFNLLSNDLAFLVVTCGGDQRLTAADRESLVKRIRQQLTVALTIICGPVSRVAIRNGEIIPLTEESERDFLPAERFLTITPPDLIDHFEQNRVPAFNEDSIRQWAKGDTATAAANAILHDLANNSRPHVSGGLRGNYGSPCELIDWSSNKHYLTLEKKDDRNKEWLVRYARARCIRSFLANEKRRRLART
jgi:hypothetical protein